MIQKVTALALFGVGLLGLLAGLSSLAIFTDSAAVDGNSFTTGTVDISTAPTTALVTFSNMAPGDQVTNPLVVTNAGRGGSRDLLVGERWCRVFTVDPFGDCAAQAREVQKPSRESRP